MLSNNSRMYFILCTFVFFNFCHSHTYITHEQQKCLRESEVFHNYSVFVHFRFLQIKENIGLLQIFPRSLRLSGGTPYSTTTTFSVTASIGVMSRIWYKPLGIALVFICSSLLLVDCCQVSV